MYSIEDPIGGTPYSGGAAQILAAETGYLCRTFPKVVITVFGIVVRGVLASDDGEKMRLQTNCGNEIIPWAMIRRVIRRDS